MGTFTWRAGKLAACAGLVLIAACETTPQRKGPSVAAVGPRDVTPQVNASTYVAHGHLLERQGNYEAAAERYRKALELAPDLLVAHNRLGVTLNRLGQHAEASEHFRHALARQPELAYLHNNLGFSLYMEGKYAEAEAELTRALALCEAFPRARMNHGLALGKLGRYDEALAEFMQAGSEADAHYNVALLQIDVGRYADAARSLEQALSLNPKSETIRQQLHEVARLAAEQEAAERAPAELAASISAAEATSANSTAGETPAPDAPPAGTEVQPAAGVEVAPTPAEAPDKAPRDEL